MDRRLLPIRKIRHEKKGGREMNYKMSAAVGMMALTLTAGARSGEATVEQRDPAATRDVDRAAQLQKQRDEELSRIELRSPSRGWTTTNDNACKHSHTPETEWTEHLCSFCLLEGLRPDKAER